MNTELQPTNSEQYTYGRGYIILSELNIDNIPESIHIEGLSLVKKSEFHITLVAANRLAKLINPEDSERVEIEITDKFKEFVKENPIENFELTHEFRLAQKGEKKTVVAMVGIENLTSFYDELRQSYGEEIPTQPAHITLYSLEPEEGISLSSPADLDINTSVVDIPVLNDVIRIDKN